MMINPNPSDGAGPEILVKVAPPHPPVARVRPDVEFSNNWREGLNATRSSRARQKKLFEVMQERLQAGIGQTQVIGKYVAQRAKASRKFAKLLGRLPSLLPDNFDAATPGSMEAVCAAVTHANTTERDTHELLAVSLHDQSHKSLAGLEDELESVLSKLESRESDLTDSINDALAQCDKLVIAWQSAFQGEQTQNPNNDPFVLQLHFWREWDVLKKLVADYDVFLADAFDSVQTSDNRRVDALEGIFRGMVQTSTALTVNRLGGDLERVHVPLNQLKNDGHFEAFAINSGLAKKTGPQQVVLTLPAAYSGEGVKEDFSDLARAHLHETTPDAPAAPASVPVPDRLPAGVDKMGTVEMDSLLRWRRCVMVLTRFGFLHFFSHDLQEPDYSVALKYCTLEADPENKRFTLHSNPAGLHIPQKFTIRSAVGSHSDIDTWVIDILAAIDKANAPVEEPRLEQAN